MTNLLKYIAGDSIWSTRCFWTKFMKCILNYFKVNKNIFKILLRINAFMELFLTSIVSLFTIDRVRSSLWGEGGRGSGNEATVLT